MDADAGAAMLGTLDSWRLDELDDRCICREDAMYSVRALLESLMA